MVLPASLGEGSPLYIFDGNTLQPQLTPNIFKAVEANTDTLMAFWTPAAGKKFRILKYIIAITGGAFSGTPFLLTVTLRDGPSVNIPGLAHTIYIPSAANYLGDYSTGLIDLGRGYLSSTINNALNLSLSAALTVNSYLVCNVCGVEE